MASRASLQAARITALSRDDLQNARIESIAIVQAKLFAS
jgi:hypothetical protein